MKCRVRFEDGSVATELDLRHVRVKGAERPKRAGKKVEKPSSEQEHTFNDGDQVDVDWTDGKTYPCAFLQYVHAVKYQVHFDDGHRGRVAQSAITTPDDTTIKRGVVAAEPITKGMWDDAEVIEGARRKRPQYNYRMLARAGIDPAGVKGGDEVVV